MKRPLAGLLASAAAIQGAWLLLDTGRARTAPAPPAPHPADAADYQFDPAAQLAAIVPDFGGKKMAPVSQTKSTGVTARPLIPVIKADEHAAPVQPDETPLPPTVNNQEPAQPAAEGDQPIRFVSVPVIQALSEPERPPAPALAALPKEQIAPPRPAPPAQIPRVLAATPPAIPVPVPHLVLAAFDPAPAPVQAEHQAVRAESTAAQTMAISASASPIYPEPAFGQPEARLVPAAFNSVEVLTPSAAAVGTAATLAQAIGYSYETNPRLLAERASTRAADLGYPAARAAFGPRVDASASLSYTRDRDEILPGSFQRQQGWSDTASLILSQPLLTFGRTQAQVGQAAANIDFRRESLKLVQNDVMLDVIAAYVGTLREAGAVTIARENVALLQRQLEDSNARFAVREITLADVQQVETRLALGRTVLLDAQARLGDVQARFYRAVGMPPGELAPPDPLTLPAASLAEAYMLADSDSPLIRAAQARERISRAFLAAARSESAPRVDFRGSADYGSMSDYSRLLRGTRVRGTVTLSVPLFDSGGRAAASGQAREANLADLQLVAAAQRDSRTAVATGWNNLRAARMSIDHYRQAVESAQRAYENAQRQERAGMRTTLDVLDLARDLLDVRNAYNRALADEYQARATLLAALGRLDPSAIAGGLKLHDPADHFRKVRTRGDFPVLTGTLAALDGVILPNLTTDRQTPDPAQLVATAETVTGE